MDNRAKKLYCDTTTFVFRFFIGYLPKKMETEKWPKAAGSALHWFHGRFVNLQYEAH